MSLTTIKIASITDAEKHTDIMKRTFDDEGKVASKSRRCNYNIQPPGYSSIEVTKYMAIELEYYKVLKEFVTSPFINKNINVPHQ